MIDWKAVWLFIVGVCDGCGHKTSKHNEWDGCELCRCRRWGRLDWRGW